MLKKECALHVAANMGAVDATKNFKLKVVFALPDVWCAKHRITSAIKTSTIDNVCLPKSKAERKKTTTQKQYSKFNYIPPKAFVAHFFALLLFLCFSFLVSIFKLSVPGKWFIAISLSIYSQAVNAYV